MQRHQEKDRRGKERTGRNRERQRHTERKLSEMSDATQNVPLARSSQGLSKAISHSRLSRDSWEVAVHIFFRQERMIDIWNVHLPRLLS
ncbi:hypothetical protein Y1Q_0022579 [Alligator mississippiensis]|uniref:Uncharacterized protein n=1 Tax=Alligator mississippiensis TaxID=8496 RepID=A0A151NQD1_ALLMI|nr:hypothetical protein Y1Q_0022579 [Alligator mississippiensis]